MNADEDLCSSVLASFWRETKDPEGVQQDSPGRKPWVQGQIAESPEGRRSEVRSQLQINARHKPAHFNSGTTASPLRGFRCCFACSQPGLAPWAFLIRPFGAS